MPASARTTRDGLRIVHLVASAVLCACVYSPLGSEPWFLSLTQAVILPGMENHFALMFSDMVTPREVVQFKLMSYAGLAWHVQRHTVDVIVLGNWTSWTANSHRFRSLIVRNGYVMKERIASAEIYTLPPDGRR